jgi:hypothetical protein
MNRFAFFIYMCVLFLLPAGRMLAADADSTGTDKLWVQIESLSFFKDNEFEGEQAKGYSLPGLWVRPLLAYQPLPAVRLEAGFHALIYAGANKYPCYAYHDIARWKGQQYQHGAHLLPWFRAQAEFRHLTIVLGNIYGAQNHRLAQPLFNQELNLSEDPEMGFQLLWDRRRLHADTWLNWQSYIFKLDTHQEAFTVGSVWRVLFGSNESRVAVSVYSLNGTLMARSHYAQQQRGSELVLPMPTERGTYVVVISTENARLTRKLVVAE